MAVVGENWNFIEVTILIDREIEKGNFDVI